MSKLESVLYELNSIESGSASGTSIDLRARLIVTLLFLISVLSLPILDLPSLILFFIYPMIGCSVSSISYGKIFKRSFIVLPFVLFVGIFNPLFDHRVVFSIEGIDVTAGWISFISIILRGLLCTQAILMLIYKAGFNNICHSLQHLGVPSILTNQLMFAYRYIFVLIQEALSMQRARTARGYGKKNYPFKMWGIFVGQLLLRTMDRADRIHNSMLSRGFTGHLETGNVMKWRKNDIFFLLAWISVFIIMRFVNPASFIFLNS